MGEREARQQAVVAVALFHAVVLLLKNTKSRAFGSTQWCLLGRSLAASFLISLGAVAIFCFATKSRLLLGGCVCCGISRMKPGGAAPRTPRACGGLLFPLRGAFLAPAAGLFAAARGLFAAGLSIRLAALVTNPPPLSLPARCARSKTDSACASLLNELAAALPRLACVHSIGARSELPGF